MATEALLMICSLLLLMLTPQKISAVESTCRQRVGGEQLTIDVFTELLSNHTDLLRTINPAPLVGDMDPNSPAFEFRGAGVHLSDEYLSNIIQQYSCSSNEITLLGSVFFKQGDSAGPVVELSYADSFGPSLPVFSMRMDALADEIVVAYRHLGDLHTEVFPARLHNGKWRRYAVTLSGNQVLVYENCGLIHQRVVPLPDYCIGDASVVLSVADSALQDDKTNMMFAFLQNVAVHFGPRGIQQTCPELPEACPSCGRFLRMVEKVYGLNEEVELLRSRVAELESQEAQCVSSATECTHTVNGESTTFSNGSFRSFPDQTVCYCAAGVVVCTRSEELCLNGSIVRPTDSPPATTGGQLDPGVPTPMAIGVCDPSNFIPELTVNETFYMKSATTAECTEFRCVPGRFGGFTRSVMRFDCPTDNDCSTYVTERDQNLALCCRVCAPCDFVSCVGDSVCVVGDNNEASCECNAGFKPGPTPDTCVDINECNETSLCSSENTVCTNTIGSYSCVCQPGFNMLVSATGAVSCEDDNECLSNACTGNTECMNSIGSFSCVCPEGTILTGPGTCESTCDPPCLHGGECVSGGRCNCRRGYTGDLCESDINECADQRLNNCNNQHGVCINVMGGYFCRCQAGFTGNGSHCEDVDECKLDLDNCLDGARCVNFPSSFQCLCGGDICTGACLVSSKRKDIMLPNRESMIVDNCRNCSCVDGELSCVKIQCGDCSTNPPRDCCPECYRQDCIVGSIRIRPGQTWVNPQNRCERIFCGSNLTPEFTNDALKCPALDCPEDLTIQPMGKCCPVCLLHPCTEKNNQQSVSLRNGCETCTCLNSRWSCSERVQCPPANCAPENILFSYDGCCPVCASEALQVLNSRLCET